MRLGFGFVAIVLALTGCSGNRAARFAAEWGCSPVEGLAAVNGAQAPDWMLVGEFTETAEAPAAVASIACNLATDGHKLFVGVSDYLGGATDAESRMIETLKGMTAKGAPIVVAKIGGEDHPWSAHEKSRAEKAWAEAIGAKVKAAGAERALLFLPRADAIASPIPPSGDRFAGYSPMPVFLPGTVVSLEIAPDPARGASNPVIRLYKEKKNGFDGQLALATLTRPLVALAIPESVSDEDAVTPDAADSERERRAEAKRVDELNHQYRPTPPMTDPERKRLLEQLLESLQEQAPE